VSGWSLVQRSPSECGVSQCDRESSIMKTPWPIGELLVHGRNKRTVNPGYLRTGTRETAKMRLL
jgi:hypothetical protein